MVTQVELQQDLERFAGDLIGNLTDSGTVLMRGDAPSDIREAAMRRLLRYESYALDIATTAEPEVGLLDMVVFVSLCRNVFERHWVRVFGEAGIPVLRAWESAESDLAPIREKVLTPERARLLDGLIADWLSENPSRVDVESVRFQEFSQVAGRLSAERANETRGLFGTVKAATQSADTALLVADRMRFMLNRVPAVLRLQVRLGASEVTSDALARVRETTRSAKSSGGARALLDIDAVMRRGAMYLVGVGGAWSVLFWGCYYVARALASHRGGP
jgi:hypothetical protein